MSFYQTVIRIISKPCDQRKDEEINLILGWFVSLFQKIGEVKPDLIKDIIKNCSFETRNPDEIIIKQGDVGDCFYVIVRGKCSVYINDNKYECDNEDEVIMNNGNGLDGCHFDAQK